MNIMRMEAATALAPMAQYRIAFVVQWYVGVAALQRRMIVFVVGARRSALKSIGGTTAIVSGKRINRILVGFGIRFTMVFVNLVFPSMVWGMKAAVKPRIVVTTVCVIILALNTVAATFVTAAIFVTLTMTAATAMETVYMIHATVP
jgi:hypothetical protein